MKLRMLMFAAGATLAVAAPAAEGATKPPGVCASSAQALASQGALLSASLRRPLSATVLQSPAHVWQIARNTRDGLHWALTQSGKRCK